MKILFIILFSSGISADYLVLKNGKIIETQGAYETQGSIIKFKRLDGNLYQLPQKVIDLTRTEKINEDPEAYFNELNKQKKELELQKQKQVKKPPPKPKEGPSISLDDDNLNVAAAAANGLGKPRHVSPIRNRIEIARAEIRDQSPMTLLGSIPLHCGWRR